jgi:hypothetical protein
VLVWRAAADEATMRTIVWEELDVVRLDGATVGVAVGAAVGSSKPTKKPTKKQSTQQSAERSKTHSPLTKSAWAVVSWTVNSLSRMATAALYLSALTTTLRLLAMMNGVDLDEVQRVYSVCSVQ